MTSIVGTGTNKKTGVKIVLDYAEDRYAADREGKKLFDKKKINKKIEGTVPIGSRYTERTQKKIVKKCHIKKKANSESLLYFYILR